MPPIPALRQLHHEYILNSLNAIAKLHGKKDTIFPITADTKLNIAINRSIRIMVNNMRANVELNKALDENARYKWLRGINEMLTGFISAYQAKIIKNVMLPGLVKAYADAMKLEMNGESILPVIAENEIEIGNILVQNYCLKDNPGIPVGKDVLVLKACQRDPNHVLPILSRYPTNSYADSLITRAAFQDPEELYNYAAAPDAFGKKIQSVPHPLVKIIAQLARIKTGRMYFPFLDELYHERITIDDIRPLVAKDTSDGYYKLLVKTRIDYAGRIQNGDTPLAANALTNKLRAKAIELYINDINALHDVQNLNVRFKKIESLTSQELYYLAVLGEAEIYTSSFVSGVYPRIFSRMKHPDSDTLLMMMHYDYYKKFIKMSAAYNTLDDFLKRMDKTASEKLMRNFVNGLEKTETLEDAVDVADSYGSIYNSDIRQLILNQVQQNLSESERSNNKRGKVIYRLLNTIFLSMDSSNHIDIAATLGINPVYYMPARLLEDTSGRVIMQQFFYGDKDGSTFFNAFLGKFQAPNWKIVRKPNWVEVSSARGRPVTIYANRPLDEKKDLDAMAQDSLVSYLEENDMHPTVVIHRGHSYYLQQTINQLPPSAKVVLLGSCGGYQKLNDVLNICPSAQIISSKQVGAGIVNQQLIDVISEKLRQGKDLNWPQLWESLEGRFSGSNKEKLDDYVPPHKNLGAIFIMAYNKAMKGE
ncbi:MAG: hypothetical protein NVS3B15_02530 [Sediminibacterium sp.]